MRAQSHAKLAHGGHGAHDDEGHDDTGEAADHDAAGEAGH